MFVLNWGSVLLVLCLAARHATVVLAYNNNDEAVSRTLQSWKGVGLTAWSLDSEGKLCSLGVAGERIKGSGQAFQTTGDSRHHVGSVTKGMTSSLLAILIEDGMIENGWDATMEQLVPEASEGRYASVTLRQVVSMLSGLPSDPDLQELISDPDFPEFDVTDVRSMRRAAAISGLTMTKPLYKPGTDFFYSNWAYLVAGHVVEDITGETWEEALATRLFVPLGIDLGSDPSDFTGAPPGATDPWGHSGDEQVPCDPSTGMCDNLPFAGPAGTFSGRVAAVARYFAWHLQCHNGAIPAGDSSKMLLSTESCRQLHQPADPTVANYGYGWFCFNHDRVGGLICSHEGTNGKNYYNVTLDFGMERAYVVYTNGAGRSKDKDAEMVRESVASLMLGEQTGECGARFPSSVYLADAAPPPAPDFVPDAPTPSPSVRGTTTTVASPANPPTEIRDSSEGSIRSISVWLSSVIAAIVNYFSI